MEIKTLGVVGAGQMGSGIAQVAASSGISVSMCDVKDKFVQRGANAIKDSLGRLVKKEKLTPEDRQAILGRITGTTSLADMGKADFVVEAATENEVLKLKIFTDLDSICRPVVILSSNTSSISITKIAGATKRPEKVIGMHFMNPVPMMKLVEIIKGLATSEETFTLTRDLSVRMGKTPVPANDFPGFISNRVLMPMINEAIYCLFEGVGTPQDIDEVMKLGMNHPMGPLTLADLIGLDTCLAIMKVLHSGLGDTKYRPCPLLVKYVDAGWLGRKSGRGFYNYK
ncbi:MAG: 3-hydroxybutyryl-CoA dehydrogenase [Desulfobacteraceae bacterium]|nr:MAG: 3-hydroxybutyryl-CoA dehydrogenase [Desulfobacteraceae bacterium]